MDSLFFPSFLRTASNDVLLLFIARGIRMLSYGSLTVILLLYLRSIGFNDLQVGLLLTCILCGDLGITFQLTTSADQWGRKRTLILGALLKVFAGLLFCYSTNFFILAIAGIVGVISSTGGEIGPFMAIEQSALMDVFSTTMNQQHPDRLSSVTVTSAASASTAAPTTLTTLGIATLFGWYNAVGYFFQALGALIAGYTITILEVSFDYLPINAYRIILGFYALLGLVKAILYSRLSPFVESPLYRSSTGTYARSLSASLPSSVPTVLFSSSSSSSSSSILPLSSSSVFDPTVSFTERIQQWWIKFTDTGIRRPESKYLIQRLSVLFFMDSFANGFVMQTFLVFWFAIRWGIEPVTLGTMISLANVLAGISGILAGRLVKQIGAIRTMVFTHLPSNLLLGLVPLMPTSSLAIFTLLLRFCVSQMDAPARQAYVTMMVSSDERSAASGVTNIARSVGLALSPLLLGIVIGGNGKDKEDLYLLSPNIHKHPNDVPFNFNLPFYIAAVIKIIYDIVLYSLFKEKDTGMEHGTTTNNSSTHNSNSNKYGNNSTTGSSNTYSNSALPNNYRYKENNGDINSIIDDIIGYD